MSLWVSKETRNAVMKIILVEGARRGKRVTIDDIVSKWTKNHAKAGNRRVS